MKHFYFTIIFLANSLFISAQTPTGSSTEVGITEGQLSVSLTGGATYAIPIAVPPGINGVVPQVGLTYNSQGGNGLAGYGWNISGVSAITRIPATKFHDGTIDAVDFDTFDRFAFDGQRLVVKNGTSTYGANGTVYETESFSNVKITSYGVHPNGANYGPQYFIVEYPDGSKAYYGNSTDSRSITDWAITYWENPQGVRISYNYISSNNSLRITSIKYGSTYATAGINEIQFKYRLGGRQRPEQAYIAGQSIVNDQILEGINVFGNGIGFRNYVLVHDVTSLGYERLISITEKSGDGTKSYNPTLFTYGSSSNSITYYPISVSGASSVGSHNTASISGDFDGDGSMDFALYPTDIATKNKFTVYRNLDSQSNTGIGYVANTGLFLDVFTSTWLTADKKVSPINGITTVSAVTDPAGNISFKTYMYDLSGVVLNYSKIVNFPKTSIAQGCTTPGATGGSNCGTVFSPPDYMYGKKYLSGDFNGDGLTDVIAIDNTSMQNIGCNYCYPGATNCNSNTCYNSNAYTVYSTKVYFIDLKRDLTSNFFFTAGDLAATVNSSSDIQVIDFNGDGKSDFIIRENGSVRVYSLNDANQLILLTTVTDAEIVLNRQMLIGDYNGDGKSDFITPKYAQAWDGHTEWLKYTSDGVNFLKQTQTFTGVTYPPNIGVEWSYRYIPMDYDNDGKTDLVSASCYGDGNPNTVTNYATVKVAVTYNKNGFFNYNEVISNNAVYAYDQVGFDYLGLPIFYNSNQPNRKLEIAVLRNNYIRYFVSQKDFSKEKLLKTATTGNGVKETITYGTIDKDLCTYNCKSLYVANSAVENYPNIDIQVAPGFQVVSKLEKQSYAVYKKQLFAYYGAVTNMEGLGFLGFRASMRTNWHDDTVTNPIISTVSKFDIGLRGANTENYSVLYYASPYSSFAPTDFISKSILTFNTPVDALQANKVFKLKNTVAKQYNGLENTNSETTTVYDAYNNPTKVTTLLKEGSTLVQTSVGDVTYIPLTASPYVVGRPSGKIQTITLAATAEITSNEEQYSYAASLLTQVKKRGNDAGVFITEDNIYDTFGNITKKTITVPAVAPNPAPAPRVTNYQYDSSGRFLTKSIDIEGLATTFAYNAYNGLLNSETNPYGLTTSSTYDPWFKKTKTTDYLGKSNTYAYSRSNSVYTLVATTGDDGSGSEETFDDLGRKTRSGVKNINGTFSYVDYLYDIYDRNYKVSEPYFGASPTQWNETKYDVYSRISQSISFTGKTVNMSYSGLTTTVNDGTKTKVSTKNAIGNVVTMTDTPGGTINYSYFANGNLKTSNYGGVVTTIEQDGWGRKTKLIDPSAGIYLYEYNLFGETTKETAPSPKGITTYKLNDFGKITEKTIIGDLTNSKTTYTYDATSKLLTTNKFEDFNEGTNSITNTYEYDTSKRLFKTTETTPYATFTKQLAFDLFGRVEKETSTAVALANGKTSGKTIKNTYQNGYPWQILDDATSQALWQTNTVNARGQLTSAALGNGISIANAYDTYGFATQFKHDKVTTNIMTLNTVFDPQKGNLTSRTNSLFNWNESFLYDNLDRLTSFTNAQGLQETQNYDDRGRITQNSVGTYNYTTTAKPYQNTSVTLTPEATGYYKNREGVFNDSMEEKRGWSISEPTVESFDNTTEAHSGAVSLKINNTTTNEKVIHSEVWTKIDNAVATEYTYTAWVKSNGPGPQAEIFLFMKTESEQGYYTLVDQEVSNTTNQWVKIEKTFLVPAYIKKLNIRLDNNGLGTLWFDDVKIRKTSNTPLSTTTFSDRQLNITYNTFKSPVEIEETGIDKISFTYNDSNGRSTMFYGGLGLKETRQYRKYYSADGSMEVKQNMTTGATEFITYIGGDAYSAPLIIKSDGTTQNYLYLHRDYQGSILAITDATGKIVEKRLFDAWGNIVKVQDGAGITLNGLTILDRGYTGHEHLQSVGLIHMNGRLYDPKLHRFLQPDNYVQEPFNTQNYNRYGYCWNNPLKFSDPSGEWIWIVAAAVIGGVVNWAVHGAQFNMEGLKAFGIGAAAGTIGALTGGAAFAAAGGAAGGIGGALAGAAGGAVGAGYSQIVLSVGNNIAFGDPLMSGKEFITGIAFGAVLGGATNGIAALRNGRTFWKGTLPNPQVSPISLPSIGIKQGQAPEIKSDAKLPSTTQTSTAPTTQNNTATAINKELGVVDVSKNPDFGIKNYPPNNGAVNGTENLEYLQKGAQIDRYGSLNGTYASPSGTPLELRSLPPSNSGVFNSFEVLKPFPVQSSTIAPWYNQPGGGIQYKLPKNINWLLENGFIKQ